MKTRKFRGGLLLLLCLTLTFGTLAPLGATAQPAPDAQSTAVEESIPYSGVNLTFNGSSLSFRGQVIDGKVLVPLRAFAAAVTRVTYYAYNPGTGYATLQTPGLTLTAGVGGTFLTANDRCLYGVTVNRMIGGEVWVPLAPLAKAMSLTYKSNGGTTAVSGSYRALTPASAYYNQEALYWLSRIISAESRGESLRGQMAVGSVVMNRVRSSQFPGTVKGVVFQKGQFTPVSNGTVYNSPAWLSVCVAKMCLEGYSISNEVLFFCNLNITSHNWITKNRQYAFTLGGHTFFF